MAENRKTLTIHFYRAISDPKLETLEVVVTPLSSANHPELDQTILGLKQTRKVTLREPVTVVTFDLYPSHAFGLNTPIFYRIAWRRGAFGRIESHEFSMPNDHVNFDDLFGLENIIDSDSYVPRSEVGIAGGVARINAEGHVVDADGNVVMAVDTDALMAEVGDRDNILDEKIDALNTSLSGRIDSDISEIALDEERNRAELEEALKELIKNERDTRSTEDGAIRGELDGVRGTIDTTAAIARSAAEAAENLGATKADLVNGKVKASQMPDIALGTAVPVDSEAEMLQLTPAQVQHGDLAVRPDGTFMLIGDTPSNLNSWKRITSENTVASVNGETGNVVLDYTDVEARPAGVDIPVGDIFGLDSVLASYAEKGYATETRRQVTTQTGRVDDLTTEVAGMQGKWTKAVQDAHGFASDASQSAQAAAQSESNISDVEQSVSQALLDVQGVESNVNVTAGQVSSDAGEVAFDRETTSRLAAVCVTAAYFLRDDLLNLGPLVNSVNGVQPDGSGNVSIFGGGTDLALKEDTTRPGLFHVTSETEQE